MNTLSLRYISIAPFSRKLFKKYNNSFNTSTWIKYQRIYSEVIK